MSTTFTHGRWGYLHHRCRCEFCTRAQNDYMREFRARNAARTGGQHPEGKPHSSSTYNNHGCRCKGPGSCTEAHRLDMRAYLDRKKAKQ